MALRLRRGTNAERQTITPLQGELLFITDTKKLYVGDGATQGGVLVGPVDAESFDIVNDTTPQLGGDLDLNGNNIIGTGNINIDGTINATGNIGLGNDASDIIEVGGTINSNLRPSLDDTYNLGTASRMWKDVWATQVNVDSTLAVGSRIVKLTNGSEDSSRILWDAESDALYGNFYGSVFGDDSTPIIDSINNKITADAGSIDILNATVLSPTTDNGGFGDNTVKISFNDGAQERITFEGVTDGTYSLLSVVPFRAYKGSDLDNKVDTEAGDILGGFGVDGYRTTGYVNAVNALAAWKSDADFNEDFPGASLTYFVGSNNSTFPTQFIMDGGLGTFSAPVLKAGSYATGDIPTGADVGVGSIVFDSTTSQFKGWNGSSWVVLG